MTIISMDNNKENSSRVNVQNLFNKNVELEKKRRKATQARIPSDPNTWLHMRENYEAIILEDHAFSQQHDIEYALWQLHYRRIEELRALFNAALSSAGSATSQNGKGPSNSGPDRITKIRTQLKTFLSEATGFYHDLMLKIKAKYGLPLGYFSDDPDNQICMLKDGNKSSELKKGLMSCHRCLIYLGDLARYKVLYGEGDSKSRDFTAASSYYMQASSIFPSSGNPHHQLAILAGYSNDELLSIYRYFRSLAVDIPFLTARDNLIIAFEKNRQNFTQLIGDPKVTPPKAAPSRTFGRGRGKGESRTSFKDNKRLSAGSVKERTSNNSELLKAFITRFIRLNGILFTRTSLETFPEVFSVVRDDLLELLSSGSDEAFNFGSDGTECRLTIVRLITIIIFTVHNLNKENENQSYADILQRSVPLQNAFTATFELIACIFERCCQLKDPMSSYLLPGIMVFVEWLACHHDATVCSDLEEKQAKARSFFWTKCITLLNKLFSSAHRLMNQDEDELCFSHMSKYDGNETANRLALSEDFELRGFVPLIPAQLILDFSRKHTVGSNMEKNACIQRIIAAGKALANVVQIGQERVYFDTKLKEFVIGPEPQIADDYLLSSTLESNLDVNFLEASVRDQMAVNNLPKLDVEVEVGVEEEDEVIVFKPSAIEKHLEEHSLKFTSSEVLSAVDGNGSVDFSYGNKSLSIGNDSFPVQNALSSGMKLPTSFADVNSQYLLSVQSGTSKCLVEQSESVNGFAHMNLMEDDRPLKSELKDQCGVSLSDPLSVHQFVNAVMNQNHFIPVPRDDLSSKFDSIISSGAASDSMSMKLSSLTSSGLKKNPVGRPVRHLGPPPGFGSGRSKALDESSNGMTVKNESPSVPQIDDYSWFDGYHFPTSNQSAGFSNSISSFHSVNNINGSMGMASFPFPGKLLSSCQKLQSENQNDSHVLQFSENIKLYSERQQQLRNEHLQPVASLQQYQVQSDDQQYVGPSQLYQGQSIWDGRFLV